MRMRELKRRAHSVAQAVAKLGAESVHAEPFTLADLSDEGLETAFLNVCHPPTHSQYPAIRAVFRRCYGKDASLPR